MKRWQNIVSLMLFACFPPSPRCRETGRSMRWRWRRRRRKSRQHSSAAGVPAAPPTPSLTPEATPTSSHLGGASGGGHRPAVDPRTASGRFLIERLKTSDGDERKTGQNCSRRGCKYLEKCKERLVYPHLFLWRCCWKGQHRKLGTESTACWEFYLVYLSAVEVD